MGKRVVILASGETERRALPYLLESLRTEGLDVVEVRIPPRNRDITVEVAVKLIHATWYDLGPRQQRPDKIVVLVDADSLTVEEKLVSLRSAVEERVKQLPVDVLITVAKWHLEAWFFADSKGLRTFLKRDLGSVDVSRPDDIENPKAHLKNLLGYPYTASTAERIAATLDAREVRRSPSFCAFEAAVRNGGRPRST
jgi:hypothetical protein